MSIRIYVAVLPKRIPLAARVIASISLLLLALLAFKFINENKTDVKFYECGKQVLKLSKVIVCN